jgi:hypothetical protein
MARKLKTYQTSLGFFDLAIAAPSMKAALEAWGADSNLFHQGAAKESDDPDVIAATMRKPGAILRRPVGSSGSFGEHAELPTDIGTPNDQQKPPGSRKAQKLRKRPQARPTRRRSAKPRSHTNVSRSTGSANGRGRRPPGRRSTNVGSRPSTRLRRPWTKPKASMPNAARPFARRWRYSRKS